MDNTDSSILDSDKDDEKSQKDHNEIRKCRRYLPQVS